MRYKFHVALLFMLPGFLGLLAFYAIPFVWGFVLSLMSDSAVSTFIGFSNYGKVMQNSIFLLGIRNSLLITAIAAPLCWAIAYVLAVVLQRANFSTNFVRSTLIVPYIMPSSAILLYFLLLFDWGGILNQALSTFGIPRVLWLSGSMLRIPVIILYLWKNIGFCAIVFSAAMQSIPKPLYEFADLEGIGSFQREWYITAPLIAPSAFLVIVFAVINSFKIFREAYFIGGPYPDESIYTFQNYMNNMFQKLNFSNVIAGAYLFATVVVAIFAVLYVLQRRYQNALS
ncbi:MAG: sugar ABC transporter permease [Eubacteriales bacterium]|nr:sugar ABC transporter permease [Eubacteriales bacterium]